MLPGKNPSVSSPLSRWIFTVREEESDVGITKERTEDREEREGETRDNVLKATHNETNQSGSDGST